jgi:hypothetical protein
MKAIRALGSPFGKMLRQRFIRFAGTTIEEHQCFPSAWFSFK